MRIVIVTSSKLNAGRFELTSQVIAPGRERSSRPVVFWTPRTLVALSGGRMRNRFDHLAKEIGQKALGPCGPTVAHDGISPETQFADLRHEPDPARKAERARLGLLGRISATLCLIEV